MNHSIRLFAAAIVLVATASTASSQPWPMANGVAVATKFSGLTNGADDPNGYVLTAYDLRNVAAQPIAVNWATVPQYHHPSWKAKTLGEIFGIALDCSGNIYVTATMTYGGHSSQIPYPWGTAGPGGVYKINGITGNIDYQISLPNSGPNLSYPAGFNTPSLGNICFDQDHNGGQVFVTNLDDGKIYRLDANLSSVQSTFDPFLPDGGTPGIAPLGERLWGIAYRANAVYFAVWSRDVANQSGPQTSVWKVNLNAAGNFTGVAQFCFSLPTTAPPDPISDMEFNAAGQLLLIQSSKSTTPITVYQLFPFYSKMYRADFTGTWNVSTTNYELGSGIAYQGSTVLDRKTSATGGCDWGFSGWNTFSNIPTGSDKFVWGGADLIHNGIYTLHADNVSGWQGMSALGGTAASSILIDEDNVVTTYSGNGMFSTGDFDVMRLSCPPGPLDCAAFSVTTQLQQVAGQNLCCATFSFTNAVAGTYTSIKATPLGSNIAFTGVSVASGWSATMSGASAIYTPNTTYIGTGTTTGLQACFTTSAPGPYLIEVTALSPVDGRFCKDTVQVDCKYSQSQPAPCIDVFEPRISCTTESNAARTFQYCFVVKNTSTASLVFGVPITSVSIATTNGGTVSPSVVTFPPLAYGAASGSLCVTITIPSTASISQSCMSIVPRGPANQPTGYLSACDAVATCVDLPRCVSCCDDLKVSIREAKIKQSGSNVIVATSFTATPGPFRSVRATIERANVSRTCAPLGRTIAAATFASGSVAGFPTPSFTPSSTSAVFGDVPAGVALSVTPISLTVALPPPPTSINCRDTVRYCIRYEFTDTTCRTCDTIVCYTIIRKRSFIDAGVLTSAVVATPAPGKQGEQTEMLEQTTTGLVTATLESFTKATVRIALRDGLYSVDKIRIATEGGVSVAGIQGGTVRDGMGTRAGIAAGTSVNIGLDLVNDVKLDHIKFYVMLDVVDVETNDTSQTGFEVLGRAASARTGDVVDADDITPKPSDIHTYALHFFAGNVTSTTVKRIQIRALDSARILAAGPFSSSETVLFRPDGGDSTTRLVPADTDDGSVIRAGKHVRPIYITVSGATNGKLHLGYTTYDSVGAVIAEGDANLTASVTSITHDDNGRPIQGIRISHPIPNPATTSATIALHTDTPTVVTMRIVDINGHVVFESAQQSMYVGDHAFIVDVTGFIAGSYRAVFITDRGTLQLPLVVWR